jgi:large subunit ribosomal protein L9
MKTRIILREDIPALGNVGDVLEVAAGFARNNLLPLGLAMPYSEEGMRAIEKTRAETEVKRAAQAIEHEALAARLASLQITFEEKVNADGHLYGAVTSKRIAEQLVAQGFELPDSHIRLPEPIREAGEFEVPIHIHGDLTANLKVWVLATHQDEAIDLDEDSEEEAAPEGLDSPAESSQIDPR